MHEVVVDLIEVGLTIASATVFTMGLRAIVSTAVIETVALLDESQTPELGKTIKLIIKAIVFFSVSLMLFLISIKIASADFVPSKIFLETCAAQDNERKIACAGYIAGVTDSYLHSNQFCIPPKVDPKEITVFTKDYVLRTKGIQNSSPVQMILYALKARWPCQGQGPGFVFQFRGFR